LSSDLFKLDDAGFVPSDIVPRFSQPIGGQISQSAVPDHPRVWVVINKCMTSAERAMISGLAQVVQRIQASAPLRYLTEAEVESSSAPSLTAIANLQANPSLTAWVRVLFPDQRLESLWPVEYL